MAFVGLGVVTVVALVVLHRSPDRAVQAGAAGLWIGYAAIDGVGAVP